MSGVINESIMYSDPGTKVQYQTAPFMALDANTGELYQPLIRVVADALTGRLLSVTAIDPRQELDFSFTSEVDKICYQTRLESEIKWQEENE